MRAEVLGSAMMRNLAPDEAGVWWGEVTSVVSFPTPNVGVLIQGASQPVTVLIANSYAQNTPQIGDAVFGWQDGQGDHWIIDTMATAFPAWVNVTTFSNSWGNQGGAFAPVRYRLVGNYVEFGGLLKGGSSNTAAFTLPAGYRPLYEMVLSSNYGIGGGGYSPGVLTITAAGVVTPIWNSGTGGNFALDGTSFPVN